jgi:hypothetical protein
MSTKAALRFRTESTSSKWRVSARLHLRNYGMKMRNIALCNQDQYEDWTIGQHAIRCMVKVMQWVCGKWAIVRAAV